MAPCLTGALIPRSPPEDPWGATCGAPKRNSSSGGPRRSVSNTRRSVPQSTTSSHPFPPAPRRVTGSWLEVPLSEVPLYRRSPSATSTKEPATQLGAARWRTPTAARARRCRSAAPPRPPPPRPSATRRRASSRSRRGARASSPAAPAPRAPGGRPGRPGGGPRWPPPPPPPRWPPRRSRSRPSPWRAPLASPPRTPTAGAAAAAGPGRRRRRGPGPGRWSGSRSAAARRTTCGTSPSGRRACCRTRPTRGSGSGTSRTSTSRRWTAGPRSTAAASGARARRPTCRAPRAAWRTTSTSRRRRRGSSWGTRRTGGSRCGRAPSRPRPPGVGPPPPATPRIRADPGPEQSERT